MSLFYPGVDITTGSLGRRSTLTMQSHAVTISGQIINRTNIGSSTDCY